MPEKREDSFHVTDRRLFTADGELRKDAEEEEKTTADAVSKNAGPQPVASPEAVSPEAPPPPTAAEQKEQADAYHKSSREMDAQVELGGHSAKELEMTFERFLASLYMTAMLQLGLMHEQGGQPRIDLIGARQTVDTLALISEKTKGNLTSAEANFLQNALYELRMAYVEVTNALANPPQPTGTDAKR
jgi:Domain of unknown function (DUF1844)